MKKYLTIISIILFTTPFVTHGALFKNITELIRTLIDIINQSIVVVVAMALLFFFWGLANFILHSADETKRAEGKSTMVWGIVALFVMISVWGLVGVLRDTFLRGGSTTSVSEYERTQTLKKYGLPAETKFDPSRPESVFNPKP